jgi:hypothetical protein
MKAKNNYTYFVSGSEGPEEGPLTLAEMKRRSGTGAITGSTFVRRSDSEHWSTAADFPELGARDVVVSPYDREVGPDALTQEREALAYAKEIRSGASWFVWIAALSIINSIAAAFGSAWGFALGLSSCYLVSAFGEAFGPTGMWVAFSLNLAASGLFFYFGFAGWKGRFWPYTIGMFLYAGDILLPLLGQDWISLVIHGLALYFLFMGFRVLLDQHNVEWNGSLSLKAGACVGVLAALSAVLFFSLQVNARAPEAAPETWVKGPHDSWPQLVLTHDAEFRGHSELQGATAFLVRLPKGDTVAVTARHLMGEAGGVSPELEPADIDSSVTKWTLHPRDKQDSRVSISGLYGAPRRYTRANEWLLLKLKDPDADALPSTPLAVRTTPVKPGEPLFVVGVRYANQKNVQEVFPAKAASTALGMILGSLEKRADFSGFSGAPVLDANGHVVGMVVGAGGPPDKDGNYSGFMAYAVKDLEPLLK